MGRTLKAKNVAAAALLAASIWVGLTPAVWADKLKVVTSSADLAYFAKQIGGDFVDVDPIASGNRDLHFVEVLPSYMLKLRKAKLYFTVGLELDTWSQPLVDGSHNPDLKVVDCSKGISPLEVPTFKVDASHGDLHRFGNPHYWLEPDNVPAICSTIHAALASADPANAAAYQSQLDTYLKAYKAKLAAWHSAADRLNGLPFICYHNSWPYFCHFFGCKIAGLIEEYPGVAPSPSHLASLISQIKSDSIRAVVYEPYFDHRIPDLLAAKTGCRAVTFPTSVGGLPGTNTYESLIDTLIARLSGAEGVRP
ncbi:MAG: zinc ABC transporter substrate-binding protein [candidate division Zixibacteria bacterium]|nr:zinc ABC transporter substrate-binding protein [candidate division Zixibacteria bacterium]